MENNPSDEHSIQKSSDRSSNDILFDRYFWLKDIRRLLIHDYIDQTNSINSIFNNYNDLVEQEMKHAFKKSKISSSMVLLSTNLLNNGYFFEQFLMKNNLLSSNDFYVNMGRLLTNYILLSASSKHVLPDISSRVSFALTTLLKNSKTINALDVLMNVYHITPSSSKKCIQKVIEPVLRKLLFTNPLMPELLDDDAFLLKMVSYTVIYHYAESLEEKNKIAEFYRKNIRPKDSFPVNGMHNRIPLYNPDDPFGHYQLMARPLVLTGYMVLIANKFKTSQDIDHSSISARILNIDLTRHNNETNSIGSDRNTFFVPAVTKLETIDDDEIICLDDDDDDTSLVNNMTKYLGSFNDIFAKMPKPLNTAIPHIIDEIICLTDDDDDDDRDIRRNTISPEISTALVDTSANQINFNLFDIVAPNLNRDNIAVTSTALKPNTPFRTENHHNDVHNADNNSSTFNNYDDVDEEDLIDYPMLSSNFFQNKTYSRPKSNFCASPAKISPIVATDSTQVTSSPITIATNAFATTTNKKIVNKTITRVIENNLDFVHRNNVNKQHATKVVNFNIDENQKKSQNKFRNRSNSLGTSSGEPSNLNSCQTRKTPSSSSLSSSSSSSSTSIWWRSQPPSPENSEKIISRRKSVAIDAYDSLLPKPTNKCTMIRRDYNKPNNSASNSPIHSPPTTPSKTVNKNTGTKPKIYGPYSVDEKLYGPYSIDATTHATSHTTTQTKTVEKLKKRGRGRPRKEPPGFNIFDAVSSYQNTNRLPPINITAHDHEAYMANQLRCNDEFFENEFDFPTSSNQKRLHDDEYTPPPDIPIKKVRIVEPLPTTQNKHHSSTPYRRTNKKSSLDTHEVRLRRRTRSLSAYQPLPSIEVETESLLLSLRENSYYLDYYRYSSDENDDISSDHDDVKQYEKQKQDLIKKDVKILLTEPCTVSLSRINVPAPEAAAPKRKMVNFHQDIEPPEKVKPNITKSTKNMLDKLSHITVVNRKHVKRKKSTNVRDNNVESNDNFLSIISLPELSSNVNKISSAVHTNVNDNTVRTLESTTITNENTEPTNDNEIDQHQLTAEISDLSSIEQVLLNNGVTILRQKKPIASNDEENLCETTTSSNEKETEVSITSKSVTPRRWTELCTKELSLSSATGTETENSFQSGRPRRSTQIVNYCESDAMEEISKQLPSNDISIVKAKTVKRRNTKQMNETNFLDNASRTNKQHENHCYDMLNEQTPIVTLSSKSVTENLSINKFLSVSVRINRDNIPATTCNQSAITLSRTIKNSPPSSDNKSSTNLSPIITSLIPSFQPAFFEAKQIINELQMDINKLNQKYNLFMKSYNNNDDVQSTIIDSSKKLFDNFFHQYYTENISNISELKLPHERENKIKDDNSIITKKPFRRRYSLYQPTEHLDVFFLVWCNNQEFSKWLPEYSVTKTSLHNLPKSWTKNVRLTKCEQQKFFETDTKAITLINLEFLLTDKFFKIKEPKFEAIKSPKVNENKLNDTINSSRLIDVNLIDKKISFNSSTSSTSLSSSAATVPLLSFFDKNNSPNNESFISFSHNNYNKHSSTLNNTNERNSSDAASEFSDIDSNVTFPPSPQCSSIIPSVMSMSNSDAENSTITRQSDDIVEDDIESPAYESIDNCHSNKIINTDHHDDLKLFCHNNVIQRRYTIAEDGNSMNSQNSTKDNNSRPLRRFSMVNIYQNNVTDEIVQEIAAAHTSSLESDKKRIYTKDGLVTNVYVPPDIEKFIEQDGSKSRLTA